MPTRPPTANGWEIMKNGQWSPKKMAGIWTALALALILWGAKPVKSFASSLLYKSYVIRYDRGWDVLCEPYEVQPNDWVLKIFRQKGEISTKDFREFLGIFKRLNPHVKNIDRIRPGQIIDIPLKKIDPNTLPGQASGIVTIPFVTLSKSSELIHRHCQRYKVRRGDTVSKLIARRFGRFGSRSYKEGVKLFKAANPNIKNLNLIYAGRRIYLPDPAIRKKAWYASLYDKEGNIRKKIDSQALAETAVAPIQALREANEKPASSDPLAQVASVVEGKLYNRGTYYFPRQGRPDFELDLERYPVLDLNDGQKIIFTHESKIMDVESALLETYWPNVKIITLEGKEKPSQILDKLFNTIEQDSQANELYLADQGTQITVRARWIKPAADNGRRICITPIQSPDQKTPESIRRYLDQLGIVLREILEDGGSRLADTSGPDRPDPGRRHRVKPVTALAPAGIKDLVSQVMGAFGYTFSGDIEISFPYAGIQVKALSNLISSPDGRQWLIDFGDLYGDAVKAIENSGLPVIQIRPGTEDTKALALVFKALGKRVTLNPSYLAARRPPDYNTTITIEGIVVQDSQGDSFLLTNTGLHPAIANFLTARGIKLIEWSS